MNKKIIPILAFSTLFLCSCGGGNNNSSTDTTEGQEKTYTVTLNANGGYYGTTSTKTKTITNISTLKSADCVIPSHDNKSFNGWYFESTCSNYVTFDYALSKDLTIYAGWSDEASENSSISNIVNLSQTISSDKVYTYTTNSTNASCSITLSGYFKSNESFVFKPHSSNQTLDIYLSHTKLSTSNTPIKIVENNGYTFDKVTIHSDNDVNSIYQSSNSTSSEDATIYCKGDLDIKGSATLKINDSSSSKGLQGIDKAIHCTGDLDISNLSLMAFAPNTAIHAGNSIDIKNNAYVLAYSSTGAGLKTTKTDLKSDGTTRNGDINITDSSHVEISSTKNGINASHNVNISGSPVISIYTGTFNGYYVKPTIDSYDMYLYKTFSSDSDLTKYYYTVTFYNSSGQEIETNQATLKKVKSKDMGGSSTNANCFYHVSRPTSANKFVLKKYNVGSSTPILTSSNKGFSSYTSYDALSFSDSSTISFGSWGSYDSLSGKESATYVKARGKTDWGSKGIKACNINISGGSTTLKTCDDAIHGTYGYYYEPSSSNTNSYEIGQGNVTISGGTITINYTTDDGIHSDNALTISGGTINFKETTGVSGYSEASYEGLEAGQIYISGGTTTIYAQDDSINATETGITHGTGIVLNISGGYTSCSSYGQDVDGIDSNNTYVQTGGTVITRGKSGSAFDINNIGTFSGSDSVLICLGKVENGVNGANKCTISSCGSGNKKLVLNNSKTVNFYNKYNFLSSTSNATPNPGPTPPGGGSSSEMYVYTTYTISSYSLTNN